ncbi:MAG TPA: filamentous hemagglutinin N-terminal domain-containing protein [Verrucomicrobiae bacterium]|nr:filamentous hemagglutinin N-terminal domain-containing protein [Verrucomicrobiae bacterium]
MKGQTFNCGSSMRISILVLSQLVWLSLGHAQVVMDTSFGRSGGAIPKVSGNYDITASLGKTVENNLFHSFSQFDLAAGDVATFSGPANIQNILSRITGPDASSIDGTIRSTIDGANLFFLNPHGVIFGPNAQVDVKGSFVATSAHYIGLSDGHRFDTINPSVNDPLLTSASPSAFGFAGPTVAPISFNGCTLSVPDQKSFAVVGGDVQIVNGQLQAAGGRINVISVGSAGTVNLDVDNLNATVDTSGFSKLGTVSLADSTLLGNDGSSVGGGKAVIHAEDLSMDNSLIEMSALGAENGLGVDIQVRNGMTLDNTSYIFSDTGHFSAGNGGDINIQALQLELLNGSAITCDVHGPAGTHGGNISVTADSIILDGQSNPNLFAGIGARTASGGDAGAVTLNTDTLAIRNGMIVSTVSAGAGNAGNTTVSASTIQIDGHGKTTGIIADTTTGGGNGGDVNVATGSLEISNGGRISSATSGSGNGGRVTVTASDSVLLDGEEGLLFTGLGVPPLAGATGNGGDLVVNTSLLKIMNGARILAGTQGGGNGGNINVTATDVVLDGGDATFLTGIEAQTRGDHNAGNITVNTHSLSMINGSQINADTSGTGSGGDINITADTIDIKSAAALSATSDGQGQGGKITVAADSMRLDGIRADGSVGFAGIFAGNFFGVEGNARAGDIDIQPGDSGKLSLRLLNGAQISASTKGASDGGSIAIDATDVTLNNHASIQCSTVGSGEAGNITLTVRDTLRLRGDSDISVPSASRDGGNITLAVGKLVYLLNSSLTASAGDNGGNITIDPVFLVLNQSSIHADAINNNGGRITILADYFFRSASPITADSQFGNPGEVLIQATELDLSGELVSLPGSLLGAESQLRQWCGARLPGGVSSFLVLGKGGVSIGPDGPLPSFGAGPGSGSAK